MEISRSNDDALHKCNSSFMLSYPSLFTVTWSQCSPGNFNVPSVSHSKTSYKSYCQRLLFFQNLQQETDTRVVPLNNLAEILEHLKVILISYSDVAFNSWICFRVLPHDNLLTFSKSLSAYSSFLSSPWRMVLPLQYSWNFFHDCADLNIDFL